MHSAYRRSVDVLVEDLQRKLRSAARHINANPKHPTAHINSHSYFFHFSRNFVSNQATFVSNACGIAVTVGAVCFFRRMSCYTCHLVQQRADASARLRCRLSGGVGLPMKPFLRPAAPRDAEAVTHVLFESRRVFIPYAPSAHTPGENLEWVKNHLIPSGNTFVAEISGTVVAVLAVSRDNQHSWIEQLYVLPGYEAGGLGSLLLQHAHNILARPIRLFTFQANTNARHFYERHGYKAIQLSDGSSNEEKCPDILYELSALQPDAE